jgi:hypothetical protein
MNKTCSTSGGAQLDLACPTTSLTLRLSGSCTSNDAEPPVQNVSGPRVPAIVISSDAVGDCHYELVFANGYVTSGDIEFSDQGGGCGCASYLAPTVKGPIPIENPPSTCVTDAGPD